MDKIRLPKLRRLELDWQWDSSISKAKFLRSLTQLQELRLHCSAVDFMHGQAAAAVSKLSSWPCIESVAADKHRRLEEVDCNCGVIGVQIYELCEQHAVGQIVHTNHWRY